MISGITSGKATFASPKYSGNKYEKYLSKSLGTSAMGKHKISTPLFNNRKKNIDLNSKMRKDDELIINLMD